MKYWNRIESGIIWPVAVLFYGRANRADYNGEEICDSIKIKETN